MRKFLLIGPILCLVAYAAYAVTVPFTIQVGATGDFTFAPLHTYYISSTSCSNSNNGTSTSTPWCGPAGATTSSTTIVCGDVILVNPGSYTTQFGISGVAEGSAGPYKAVTNCPSTTGGIDGAGGINFAIVLCAGSDLEACQVNSSGDSPFYITTNNWLVSGFKTTAGSTGRAYTASATLTNTQILHHVAFINNIAYNSALGFTAMDGGSSVFNVNVPGNGPDYIAMIGNIAQNSNQLAQAGGTICSAAIVTVGPSFLDSNAGTHFYAYGNFSFNDIQSTACTSDGEAMMWPDSPDSHGVPNTFVAQNNLWWTSSRQLFHAFIQNSNQTSAKIYVLNNSGYNGNQLVYNAFAIGDINFQNNNSNATQPTVKAQNNIIKTSVANPGGGSSSNGWVYAFLSGQVTGGGATYTVGGTGNENIFKGSATTCQSTCDGGNNVVQFGSTFGTNTYSDPLYTNVSDLITNRSGVPSCTGKRNTTACMGWDATTSTLTTPSAISDLVPTAGGTASKGYQKPTTTCGVIQAPDGTTLYPSWLKGVVYLQASGWVNGATITEKAGLVTKPCNM